jgi:hypothetical protein
MKIGVSGASGHLGKAVVSELLQRLGGHQLLHLVQGHSAWTTAHRRLPPLSSLATPISVATPRASWLQSS